MLSMELIIERLKPIQNLLHVARRTHQVRDSKVICVLLLPKTRAWHCHDARLIDHIHAVDEVW